MYRLLTSGAFRLLLALAVASVWLMPARTAMAASITSMTVSTKAPYLIAGRQYAVYLKTDKAGSTDMSTTVSYAPGGSNAWVQLNKIDKDGTIPFTVIHIVVDIFDSDYKDYDAVVPFTIPINPNVTSAQIKAAALFDPLLGAKSSSERILGPYDIKQPGQISDVRAAANDDGTVTLSWHDNTNMEAYYVITRVGNDGTKTFYYEGTTDHIGLLTFKDTTTDKTQERVYQYTVTPVADPVYGAYYTDFFDSGRAYVLTKAAKSDETSGAVSPIFQSDQFIVNWGAGSVFDRFPIGFRPPPNVTEEEKKGKSIFDAVTFELHKAGAFGGAAFVDALHHKYSVSGVTVDRTNVTLKPGQQVQLVATVQPETALNKTVFWHSDHPAVATVDASGRVRGGQPGQATISVQTEEGAYVATSVVTVADDSEAQFPDVPVSHWAKDDIAEAVKLGIIHGYPDGTFRPEGEVTRAEFAVMLIRALPPLPNVPALAFRDNAEIGSWAVGHVEQAVARGIISGYPDGTFRPNNKITHAEMMVMVVRAAGLDTSGAGQTTFTDDAAIPDWAKPAVAAAASEGIVFGGIVGNRFLPQANSTRAEAASAIVRMLYK